MKKYFIELSEDNLKDYQIYILNSLIGEDDNFHFYKNEVIGDYSNKEVLEFLLENNIHDLSDIKQIMYSNMKKYFEFYLRLEKNTYFVMNDFNEYYFDIEIIDPTDYFPETYSKIITIDL